MQGVDGLHFCARQLEVEDTRILLHALWAHRLGYNVAAFLHGPSQQNLGPGLAMGLGRRFHQRVTGGKEKKLSAWDASPEPKEA